MSSFPGIGKELPWLFFSTLKFLLTKRQPEAQQWHQPSPNSAHSERTQGSISFLHGLQECVSGAPWAIQGGFYFSSMEEWGRRGGSAGCTTQRTLPCSLLTWIDWFPSNPNPGRWALLHQIYRWGNQAHSSMVTKAMSTAVHPRSSQKCRGGQCIRKRDASFSFKKITSKAGGF